MCPPPVVEQENNDVTHSAPSMCVEGKMMEEDIMVTLCEGVVDTTEGVSVCENDVYNEGDSGDIAGKQEICRDEIDRGEDNKTRGGGDSGVGVQVCEFRWGWCTVHIIKGDNMQRKVKKWAKKKQAGAKLGQAHLLSGIRLLYD